MNKPSIAELLLASGHADFQLPHVLQASQTLYGDIGANLDERDWAAIMAAANPLAAAQNAIENQWQDADYLLRNANHLIGQGYSPTAVEFTYRQMADRLDFTYDASWSAGTQYAWLGALSDQELAARVAAEATPRIAFEFTDTAANLDVSHAGTLSFSVTGASQSVNAGDVPLTPGATLREGFVTLTRDSGAAGTTNEYVVVGTNAAMNRDFGNEMPIVDRLIILGSANDNVSSGDRNDTVYGGDGEDIIYGNQGNDLIRGGSGADFINGGLGDDIIFGDGGNDTIEGGSRGHDRFTGGLGEDVFEIVNDGAWIDTITDFVSGTDRLDITGLTANRPLPAIGTPTATTSAGAMNSIEIADNDVHYVSVNGQAGNLTTNGTATLNFSDLTASTLTNLAAYLDERFTNAVDRTAGDDAIFAINWIDPSLNMSYLYEFTENNNSANVAASELSILAIINRTNTALTLGDII